VTAHDVVWSVARVTMGLPTLLFARGRAYGAGRVPAAGGLVYAINHIHWIDIPLVGALSPRNIHFVAKSEATDYPLLGHYLRWHGTIGIRRGESDREAVRRMREAARGGAAIGLFVEGTRQKTGVPGRAQPGAAMVALQEDVPLVPVAVYGSQLWRIGNFAPCSVAFGAPVRFEALPKGGRGYRVATAEIERRISVLFEWLADVHAQGRPRGLEPPL
jgi:1-acyl-sn-glycerol-3-phosphate acyltransferase